MVQLGRSATGASSNGTITRSAASLFTGAGPGATVAFNTATPPRMKSLRRSRTVSSRTPNASAMRGLVQPVSVSSTARARSASPRSREPASAVKAMRCSSVAESGDCPAMPCTCESVQTENQPIKRWSSCGSLLSEEDNDPPPDRSFGGEITRPGATVILWHAFTLGTGLRQLC